MSEEKIITILGEEVPFGFEKRSIHDLKFFRENPRVHSTIFRAEGCPTDDDELQEFIEKEMMQQPSVKNLIPEVRENKGLTDEILVRHDTKEVIEGNSRLAVYRHLYRETNDPHWAEIPCKVVASLTPEQTDSYLNQIHVKGKTPWLAYEKANLAFTRKQEGVPVKEISRRLSATENEINKRVEAVGLMHQNKEETLSNFSYYDVLIRTQGIRKSSNYNNDVENFILRKIKNMKKEDANDRFKAEELRNKLPLVLKNKKVLKKFLKEELSLDEAYQDVRPSSPLRKVRMATEKVDSITGTDVNHLEQESINALLHNVKRLSRKVARLKSIIEEKKEKNVK